MKFKWLIQDTGLIVSQIYKKYDALHELNENVSSIGVIKDHPYITGIEDALEDDLNTIYIILGGVKILNILKAAKHISDVVEYPTDYQNEHSETILESLINGIFYDYEKFDQKYYGSLNLPLLNNDANYIPLKDNLDTTFDQDMFIKPSRDLKAFDAGIISSGTKLGEYVNCLNRQRFYLEEDVVVSSVKNVIDEYRFFVVNNEVVTGSAYRLNGKPQMSTHIPLDILSKANDYAKLYQPTDIFTMDLAQLNDETISIIEYNCFNCSGVYDCDLVKTFQSIKDYLSNKHV